MVYLQKKKKKEGKKGKKRDQMREQDIRAFKIRRNVSPVEHKNV